MHPNDPAAFDYNAYDMPYCTATDPRMRGAYSTSVFYYGSPDNKKGYGFGSDNPNFVKNKGTAKNLAAGGGVDEVYLAIKNPFDVRDCLSLDRINKIYADTGTKPLTQTDMDDFLLRLYNNDNKSSGGEFNDMEGVLFWKSHCEILQKAGYDGLMNQYITQTGILSPFSSEQIINAKSGREMVYANVLHEGRPPMEKTNGITDRYLSL